MLKDLDCTDVLLSVGQTIFNCFEIILKHLAHLTNNQEDNLQTLFGVKEAAEFVTQLILSCFLVTETSQKLSGLKMPDTAG